MTIVRIDHAGKDLLGNDVLFLVDGKGIPIGEVTVERVKWCVSLSLKRFYTRAFEMMQSSDFMKALQELMNDAGLQLQVDSIVKPYTLEDAVAEARWAERHPGAVCRPENWRDEID